MATPMTVSQVVSQCKKWKIPYEVYSDAVGRPGSFTPIGFIIHHTGGPFTESDSYLRFLFEIGRPSEGIPAQLCQFSGGPSGKIYIGKMARANHAGRGDWTTRQLVGAENYPGYSREIIPGSDDYGTGNALYYGLEINYPGTVKMKNAQYDSAVRLAVAIMDFHGWTALSAIGHREHSSRKWDPGQAPLDKFRRDVRDLLAAGPDGEKDWFDMATEADLKKVVDSSIKSLVPGIVDKRADVTDSEINDIRIPSVPDYSDELAGLKWQNEELKRQNEELQIQVTLLQDSVNSLVSIYYLSWGELEGTPWEDMEAWGSLTKIPEVAISIPDIEPSMIKSNAKEGAQEALAEADLKVSWTDEEES